MSIRKGLKSLMRWKAASPALNLESIEGWFPVGKRRECSPDTAMKLSAVNACVEIISNSIGMLPAFVEDAATRRHLDDHSLGRVLWERPNEAMTPFDFTRVTQVHRLLRGNAYIWLYRDGYGQVREMIPLPPGSCEPVIEPGTGMLWYVASEPKTGRLYKLNPADVLHYKAYSTDGIKGISVLHRAQLTLQAAFSAQEYEQALYDNGGRPSGILKTATDLGEEIQLPDGTTVNPKDVIRKKWDEVYSGAGNSFRVAVLDQGLDYVPIAMSNSDAQFVENKAVTVEDISPFFLMPLHKLNTGKQSYQSNEANEISFLTTSIQPYVTQLEQEDTYKLLTVSDRARGLEVKRNMMALLRGDSRSRVEWYKAMREIGAFNVNDILSLEDRPDVPGGDIRYGNLNFVPLEDFRELSRLRNAGNTKQGE